ncbi:MAG: Ferrous iron transport protein B [Candidatus Ordinivivax streblomastigis]|uniref:Ferrous iron transport protein B n=1 Tax=Candidatus Ordinivivax streblomastigis TaxID=2540710 RepID=A0A5M8P2W2_9BACT|nr:MAG: Ferrous iron transport protein B [Candidatus Ordinivivax streblomastigis]
MKLSDLLQGQKGIIIKVRGRGAFRRRIIEMGFVRGKEVEVITQAPLRDPTEYKVMDYEVSLRKSEADLIEIITPEEARQYLQENNQALVLDEHQLHSVAQERSKMIHVALVGNPNSGKTSLFNIASGTHEHVGNYSGVTVNAKEGKFRYKGYTFLLVDLPGTYSLSAYSPEEVYVRKHILESAPDIIINVVAASNLERNLYLTTQLIDMDATAVIALNMYDELEKSGATFDYERLASMIGYPIVPTIAKSERGIDELFDQVIEVYEGKSPIARHIHINYGEEIETGIKHVKELIKKEELVGSDTSLRSLSIQLLEYDSLAEKAIQHFPNARKILAERDIHAQYIKDDFREDSETALTDARYGFIDGALKQTYQEGKRDHLKITHLIDPVVTSKFWGYPIFFLFMFLMFEGTFFLGQYPMDGIEWLVSQLSRLVSGNVPAGPLKDLLVNGIIGGVGSVIVFLPNIVILYLFISFMEDTGYMARAAFIMDKFMQKIGLHGKSFIPLVMGFGCNVPAIMSTRIIESRSTRLITILTIPLMSCSARLPVYILLVSIFFPHRGGFVLFGLYVTGILLAIIMAKIFKRFLIKREDLPFVMELPPYRMPTLKAMSRHAWDKTSQYLKKMGGIILVASIIIWFLEYFPQNHAKTRLYETQIAMLKAQNGSSEDILTLQRQQKEEQKQNSYIGRIGHFIEPVVRPLGFDWKISASLISGMTAKEIVVSTLGILYTGVEEDEWLLKERIQAEVYSDGSPVFTPLTALSVLVFVLIYFPCIATIAAVKNETGSWKWAGFVIVYTTSLAWIVSFLVYQTGLLLKIGI